MLLVLTSAVILWYTGNVGTKEKDNNTYTHVSIKAVLAHLRLSVSDSLDCCIQQRGVIPNLSNTISMPTSSSMIGHDDNNRGAESIFKLVRLPYCLDI